MASLFDSTKQILRSEGKYINGKMDGVWHIFNPDGTKEYEIEFLDGQMKNKIKFDSNGKQLTLMKRSNANLFVKNNEVLLILFALIPIFLFRITWNILTYNKIHNKDYIPVIQNWQKGGIAVNFYYTFIFWWPINNTDSDLIKDYKRIGNWIPVLSIICFVSVTIFLILFGQE